MKNVEILFRKNNKEFFRAKGITWSNTGEIETIMDGAGNVYSPEELVMTDIRVKGE